MVSIQFADIDKNSGTDINHPLLSEKNEEKINEINEILNHHLLLEKNDENEGNKTLKLIKLRIFLCYLKQTIKMYKKSMKL